LGSIKKTLRADKETVKRMLRQDRILTTSRLDGALFEASKGKIDRNRICTIMHTLNNIDYQLLCNNCREVIDETNQGRL
jgi:hypothetical protein